MSTEAATLVKRSETYRDYPPELKASIITAIENNGGNVRQTAQLFGIPTDTVYYWWKNSDRFREIQVPSTFTLADKLESIAHQQADSIAAHDLSIVAIADKARVLAVTIDKMQLLRGQPTSISVNLGRDDIDSFLASSLSDIIDVTPEPDE